MQTENNELPKLPQRRPEAHKGDFGHVLVVAGSPGMSGAGCMAAAAAQRAGAGLVTLALPRSLNLVAESALWSVMSMPLPETAEGSLGAQAARCIMAAADRFDVFAIGPGLRTAEETRQMVRVLVRELRAPVVVDADGLNALAGHPEALREREAPTILTPHPGEMSRLAGCSSAAEVQADRAGVARGFARDNGVLVVLKGHGTVVTDGERLYVNDTGSPGMATGGMGDVLTGLIAGLLCQGLEAFDAARLGVFVHGLAGEIAAEQMGELSLIPEDVLQRAPGVLAALERVSLRTEGQTVPADLVQEEARGPGAGSR